MWETLAGRLEGQLVVLEPLRPEHADGLFAAALPPGIWEWWPFNPATDRSRFDEWLGGVLAAVADGREVRFATLDAETGRPLGSTSYCTLRPEHRSLEIGWTWLTPSAWGAGVNTEAKLLQLQRAFEALGCQRVEFETDAENARSRRALEALPARHEGVLRDWKLLPDGRRRSSAVYSILDFEWPAVRANLERRVAAAARRRPSAPSEYRAAGRDDPTEPHPADGRGSLGADADLRAGGAGEGRSTRDDRGLR